MKTGLHRKNNTPQTKMLFPDTFEQDGRTGIMMLGSEFNTARLLNLDHVTQYYKHILDNQFTPKQHVFIDAIIRSNINQESGAPFTSQSVRDKNNTPMKFSGDALSKRRKKISFHLSTKELTALTNYLNQFVECGLLSVSTQEKRSGKPEKRYAFTHPAFEEWYRLRALELGKPDAMAENKDWEYFGPHNEPYEQQLEA